MADTPTKTWKRKMAYIISTILSIYAMYWLGPLLISLVIALCLNKFYMQGYDLVDLANFKTVLPNYNLSEEQLTVYLDLFLLKDSARPRNLQGSQTMVRISFIFVIAIASYAYFQWRGCQLLRKGVELDRDPREAYRLVRRHQFIQRLVLVIEFLTMIGIGFVLNISSELHFIDNCNFYLIGGLCVLRIFRIQCIVLVDLFENELLDNIQRELPNNPASGNGEREGQTNASNIIDDE